MTPPRRKVETSCLTSLFLSGFCFDIILRVAKWNYFGLVIFHHYLNDFPIFDDFDITILTLSPEIGLGRVLLYLRGLMTDVSIAQWSFSRAPVKSQPSHGALGVSENRLPPKKLMMVNPVHHYLSTKISWFITGITAYHCLSMFPIFLWPALAALWAFEFSTKAESLETAEAPWSSIWGWRHLSGLDRFKAHHPSFLWLLYITIIDWTYFYVVMINCVMNYWVMMIFTLVHPKLSCHITSCSRKGTREIIPLGKL